MIDARSDILFSEADKHIDRMCASLADLAHAFGYRVSDSCLQDQIYDIFLSTYFNQVEPIFDREEHELVFRRSGEAAAENKADDAHDKLWYQRLMNSSIGEPND